MSFFLKSYWVYSVEINIYYSVYDSLLFIDTFPSYIQKSLGDAFFMVLLVFFCYIFFIHSFIQLLFASIIFLVLKSYYYLCLLF